jgi:hypothetical protein
MGVECVSGGSVADGIRRARDMAGRGLVLIIGSHYLVGEAMVMLAAE